MYISKKLVKKLDHYGFKEINGFYLNNGIWAASEASIKKISLINNDVKLAKKANNFSYNYLLVVNFKQQKIGLDYLLKTTYGSIGINFDDRRIFFYLENEKDYENYIRKRDKYVNYLNFINIKNTPYKNIYEASYINGNTYSQKKNDPNTLYFFKELITDLFLFASRQKKLVSPKINKSINESNKKFQNLYIHKIDLSKEEKQNISELLNMPLVEQHCDISNNNVIFDSHGYNIIDLFDTEFYMPIWFDSSRLVVTKAWDLFIQKEFFKWYQDIFYKYYSVNLISARVLAVCFRIADDALTSQKNSYDKVDNHQTLKRSMDYFLSSYNLK